MAETKSNREHAFDIELATIHRIVEKAILLKNFDYWVTENERRKLDQFCVGGKYWTTESISSLHKKYPYMKKASLKRWVNELADIGWLEILKKQSDTSFYRPGKVYHLWANGQNWELAQNEPTPKNQDWPKTSQGLAQNEPRIGPKWPDNWPKMSHNNIDSNIDLNVELNIEKGVFDFSNVEAKNEPQKNSAAPQNPKPSPVEAPVDQAPPNGAAPPPKNQDSAFQDRPFAVTMCAQEETPTGPVLVRLHGETVRVPVQEPKTRKAKPRAAEITPEQIAQHLQPKEQAFFAQVLANGAWETYLDYKAKEKNFKYKSAQSSAEAVRNMIEATAGNADIAHDVVRQARGRGWSSLYPIKNNNTNATYGQHNRQPQPQPDLSDFHAGIGSFFGRAAGE